MELVLDFGNTNKKAALFEEDKMIHFQQFPDISLPQIREILEKNPGIRNCILSSVIPHPPEINDFLNNRVNTVILSHTTPIPLKNCYKTPETLGLDRLASAVGGAARFPGSPVLVITAGTCITCDFVTASGEYLGGSISPGMLMRFRALHTFTGKLPLIEYQPSFPLTGDSTENSILSGVINGIVAETESSAGYYRDQFPGVKIILSGGDLNYFETRLKISIFAVTNLVLEGLCKILRFNVS